MIYRFPITPKPAPRVNQQDSLCFRIPEECPHGCGWPRKKGKDDTDYCPHMLSEHMLKKKRQLEKYNEWKYQLGEMAKKMNFLIPDYGWSIYFFIPIPSYFPKKKRKAYHGMFHDAGKKDWDNLYKAFTDTLRKDDGKIGQISGGGKFWVDSENGWIEVFTDQEIYDPFGKYKSLKKTLNIKTPFISQADITCPPQIANIKNIILP